MRYPWIPRKHVTAWIDMHSHCDTHDTYNIHYTSAQHVTRSRRSPECRGVRVQSRTPLPPSSDKEWRQCDGRPPAVTATPPHTALGPVRPLSWATSLSSVSVSVVTVSDVLGSWVGSLRRDMPQNAPSLPDQTSGIASPCSNDFSRVSTDRCSSTL